MLSMVFAPLLTCWPTIQNPGNVSSPREAPQESGEACFWDQKLPDTKKSYKTENACS